MKTSIFYLYDGINLSFKPVDLGTGFVCFRWDMSWPAECSPAVVSSSSMTTRSQSTCCLIFCSTCCSAAHLQSNRRWGHIWIAYKRSECRFLGCCFVLVIITRLLPGNGGDAGRADKGWWTRSGALPGDGLQPFTAQHSDRVQHVVSPHAVEPPHPLLQTQTQRLADLTKTFLSWVFFSWVFFQEIWDF